MASLKGFLKATGVVFLTVGMVAGGFYAGVRAEEARPDHKYHVLYPKCVNGHLLLALDVEKMQEKHGDDVPVQVQVFPEFCKKNTGIIL